MRKRQSSLCTAPGEDEGRSRYSGELWDLVLATETADIIRMAREHDKVVILELEERSRVGEHTSTVNSVSIYEFNAAGKLRHLDIYLQMPPMDKSMMQAYG